MPQRFNPILDIKPEETFPAPVDFTDFHNVLSFFRLLDDKEIKDDEKYIFAIRLFFKSNPENPQKAIENIGQFISGADGDESEEGGKSAAKKIFCYNQDSGRLFAAFWQTYGIDLRSFRAHWYVFQELFQNLPENTRLMQVVELRGKKPDKNASSEERKALRKAQNAVRLKDTGGDTAALDDFFDRIAKG